MTALILVQLFIGMAAQADVPWYVSYESGLELIKSGEYSEAYEQFSYALEANPTEGLAVPTKGAYSVDYLPHLYLAITAFHSDNRAAADEHIRAAEVSGVAELSSVGAPLLDHYAVLVRASGADTVTHVSAAKLESLQPEKRKPVVLTEKQLQALKRETLTRCGLPDKTPVRSAPWYFHYEMGMGLAERGDPQRAVDFLVAAAERKPMPKEYARMYGMWFTNYRPYLEIAQSHVELGNWSCAYNALQLSDETGEAQSGGGDVLARYHDLLEECEHHLGAAER